MPRTSLSVRLLLHTPAPEQAVAMAARICYAGCGIEALGCRVEESDAGAFVERLLSLGHMSPFEHPSFTFGVEGVSRALLAQATRHRIASFSVQSQRYVEAGGEGGGEKGFGYIVPPAIVALGREAVERFESQMRVMAGWYGEWKAALGENKAALEDARFVLPNACETKLLVTMNARELMHFFALRCCMRAQWEIRAMAWTMLGLSLQAAPNIFSSAGPNCVRRGCTEGGMSCGMAETMHKRRQELGKLAESADAVELADWAQRVF